jgi:hypothetical protein
MFNTKLGRQKVHKNLSVITVDFFFFLGWVESKRAHLARQLLMAYCTRPRLCVCGAIGGIIGSGNQSTWRFQGFKKQIKYLFIAKLLS